MWSYPEITRNVMVVRGFRGISSGDVYSIWKGVWGGGETRWLSRLVVVFILHPNKFLVRTIRKNYTLFITTTNYSVNKHVSISIPLFWWIILNLPY